MNLKTIMYMSAKKLVRVSLVVASLLLLVQLGQSVSAQCDLIDKSKDALFVNFDRMPPNQGSATDAKVALRLHNNSSCVVLITSAEVERFLKPLPQNPTPYQLVKREVEYDLPDGVLVPALQYTYTVNGEPRVSVGGDNFYGFRLMAGRSLLFEVPLRHLELDSRINLSFQYAWEAENRSTHAYRSVENTVYFWTNQLPASVKALLKK